jgi:hypothetical protein
MPPLGQKRRFKSLPATSGLPTSTDIIRPVRLVRLAQEERSREPQMQLGQAAKHLPCLANRTENCLPGKSPKTCPAPPTKIFPLNLSGKSSLQARPVPPEKGADRESSRTRGGMRWTRQRRARRGSQGGSSRERSAGARTNDAANRPCRNSPGGTRPGRIFGGDGRGRRSRVVLAPRCWRQVLRRCIRSNRVWDASVIRKATVARKPGHRGEREVSRKPFARGKPE